MACKAAACRLAPARELHARAIVDLTIEHDGLYDLGRYTWVDARTGREQQLLDCANVEVGDGMILTWVAQGLSRLAAGKAPLQSADCQAWKAGASKK